MGITRLNDGAGKSIAAFIVDEVYDGQHRDGFDVMVKNRRMVSSVVVKSKNKKNYRQNSHNTQHKQRQRRRCIYRRLCSDPRRRPKGSVFNKKMVRKTGKGLSTTHHEAALIVRTEMWTFYSCVIYKYIKIMRSSKTKLDDIQFCFQGNVIVAVPIH